MNKLIYILKGIGTGIVLFGISEITVSLLNNLVLYFKLYNHLGNMLEIYAKSLKAWQFLFVLFYAIGFEFLHKKIRYRLIFTIVCLVLYFVAIISGGLFSWRSGSFSDFAGNTIVPSLIYPVVVVFIRELIMGKILHYLWSSSKHVEQTN